MYPCVVHEQSPSEYLTKVQTSSLLKENSDSLLNPFRRFKHFLWEKFGNLTPNWTASQALTPNSTTLQKLTPWARILSKRGTHLIFYHIPYIWHCLLLWRDQTAPDLSTHESQAVEKGTLDRVSCSNIYDAKKRRQPSLAPSRATNPSEPGGRLPESADSTGLPPLRLCQSTPCWFASPPCGSRHQLQAGGRLPQAPAATTASGCH
jgi:hypothetical protein